MIIAIILVLTPLAVFVFWDLLTNGSTGTVAGMQTMAAHPEWWNDALIGIGLAVIVCVLFVASQVILIPFFMRGGKVKDE